MGNKKPLGNDNNNVITKGLFCRFVSFVLLQDNQGYIMDKPTIRNSDAVRDIRLISPNDEGIIISVCCIINPFYTKTD